MSKKRKENLILGNTDQINPSVDMTTAPDLPASTLSVEEQEDLCDTPYNEVFNSIEKEDTQNPTLTTPEFEEQEDHFAFPQANKNEREQLPDISNKKPVTSPTTDLVVGQVVRMIRNENGKLVDHWGKELFHNLLGFDMVVTSVWTNEPTVTVMVKGGHNQYAMDAKNLVPVNA